LKTTATIITGWIVVAVCLSAGIIVANPPWGAMAVSVGTESVAQADPPGTASVNSRRQADDLLDRARQAMAEDDLGTADLLISEAEKLNVNYGLMPLGDTPKKARRDLQKRRDGVNTSLQRPSQLFSALTGKAPPPNTDPFSGRNAQKQTEARLHVIGSPYAMTLDTGDQSTSPAGNASPTILTPNTPAPNVWSPGVGLGGASYVGLNQDNTAGAGSKLLLQARRALAVGDVSSAKGLAEQAKQVQAQYRPLDDTPEKVEAAIRKYQDVIGRAAKDTEAYRRTYSRMLMKQANALLRAGDHDEAERLADLAFREQLTYSPFEVKPSDLLSQIAAARRQVTSPDTGPSPGIALAASSDASGPSLAARKKCDDLVRQARAALETNQLGLAEMLANKAELLQIPDAAYSPGDDRPGLVLLDVRKARLRDPSGVISATGLATVSDTEPFPSVDGKATRALYDSWNDPTQNIPAEFRQTDSLPQYTRIAPRQLDFAQASPAVTPLQDPRQQAPSQQVPPRQPPLQQPLTQQPSPTATLLPSVPISPGANGMSLFRQGEAALKAYDKQRAYEFFRQAVNLRDQLDPVTQQRLQSYLQLLSPSRSAGQPVGPGTSIVDEATAKQQLLIRQLSVEVTQREAKARSMLPTDPNGALALLEETRKMVEASPLEPAGRDQLLRRVDREVTQSRRFIEQNRPRIELDQRNQQVRDEIDREQSVKLDIQEKLARLVDDFNKRMDEERYPEAEVLAKRAAELDPENPVVQQLLWQSKFVRRHMHNLALRDQKEEGYWAQMDSVTASSVGFDDRYPIVMPDAKEWEDLTRRRSKLAAERRRHQTEGDLEIERKLRHPIPLDFKEAPLSEVLDYLSKLTDVNMHLDPEALSEYGVSTDAPVTIVVRDEIMLKSALNLILEPLHLSYVIKDEVLKITSEQQREGEVFREVYSVADLVMPIPNFVPSPHMGLAGAYRNAMGNVGFGIGAPFGAAASPMAVMASRDGTPGSAMINPAVLAQMPSSVGRSGGNMPMGFGPGGLGGGSQADFDSLMDLITSTIAPTTWDDVGGAGSIAPFDTNLSLVVSQTQDVHEEINDLLEQLRKLQDLQVTIEVRFITLNDNFFERIGVDFDFDIDDDIDRPYQVFGRKIDDATGGSTGDPLTGTEPNRNTLDVDHDRSVTVGMQSPGVFSADLDIPFTQNSFGLSVPQFGGFDASAGAQLGFAIISDIEAFFFINAASGDRRSNVLQAPKVTLFNGQQAYVSDTSQSPFVVSVIPVVGDFAAAQQPVIVVLSEGTFMTVQAVVSNDRRFVRLTVVPFFSKIGEVNTFQFTGSQSTTTDTSTEGVVDPNNADPNSANNSSNNTTTSREGTTVQLPTFSFVTVTTTVSVPDGGTVLLGGIKRLSEGRNEFGVPILKSIPYVNRLFKNVGVGRETQSLMMMVTPRIIIQEEEEERLGILTPD